VNVLSSVSPIYPSSGSMSPAGTAPSVSQETVSGNTVAPGEKSTANDTGSARAVGQASDNNPGNRATEKESERERNSGQSGQKGDYQNLSPDELKELTELKSRDREVRAHEAAHQSAGGQYAGAMSFTYERGPDGAQYAVGGEVSIDAGPVQSDPQATIEKMRVVRSAAMAPAQPSAQDRAVAAQAMQTMLQAQAEMAAGEDEDALSVFA